MDETAFDENETHPDSKLTNPSVKTTSNTIQSDVIKIPKRKIIIEPYNIIYVIAQACYAPITAQYLLHRFSNGTLVNLEKNSSCYLDKNSSDYELYYNAQKQASTWQQNYESIGGIINIFVGLFIGGFMDRIGRKFAIILNCIASLLRSGVTALIIIFNLPISFLIIVGIAEGFTMSSLVVNAYITDITTPKERGLRMAIIESITSLGRLPLIGLGHWIESSGFMWPMVTVSCLHTCCLLYCIFCVPETIRKNTKKAFCSWQTLVATGKIFVKKGKNGRRQKALLCAIVLVSLYLPMNTEQISILFQMAKPLCWTPVLVGYYSTISSLIMNFGTTGGVWLFRKCLPDLIILNIGALSGVASNILNAFAKTMVLMFLVPLVGIFRNLCVSMMRCYMSTLYTPEDQGALCSAIFTIMATTQVLCTVITNQVYQASLETNTGTVFFVTAAYYACGMVLTTILLSTNKKSLRKSNI